MGNNSVSKSLNPKPKKRRDQGFKTSLRQVNYQLRQLSNQTANGQIYLSTVEKLRSELKAKKDTLLQKQLLKVKSARERENVDFNPKTRERTINNIKKAQLKREYERDCEFNEEIAELLENLQRKFRYLKQKEERLHRVKTWKRDN